jgi:hypothetical protein
MEMTMSFDPTPYLIEMGRDKKGNPKMYLQAAHRVLWFRSDNPLGNIVTELVQLDPFPVFRAVVTNGEGVVLASGYGCAQAKAGSVYAGREVEKAETAAIARALGHAGYGSQFGGEDDDSDHLADSPAQRKPAPKVTPAQKQEPPIEFPANRTFSDEEARQFVVDWKAAENLTYQDVCAALNVSDVRFWTASAGQAHEAVGKWVKARKAKAS